MEKWYEKEGRDSDVVVASRVRLSRNLAGYPFPDTLEEQKRMELSAQMEDALKGLSTITEHEFNVCHIDKMSEQHRLALAERAIINKSVAVKRKPMSLMLSDDESISIVFNGDDHIRIQVSVAGNHLMGAWNKADRVDDFVNERYEYAFDERYGYLTSFPTNVGTGMKAYMILHLPMLSATRKFSAILSEMSRFGVSLKGTVGDGDENYGDMYVAFNQTTLGQSEESRINMLENICAQLIKQERRLRSASLDGHEADRRDQAYKAYGILKYARMLTLKEALEYLSMLRMGTYDKCIPALNPNQLYELMLSVMPNHLQYHESESSGRYADELRAEYIRKQLPEM